MYEAEYRTVQKVLKIIPSISGDGNRGLPELVL